MKSVVRILGAIAALAFAIAPMVTSLSTKAGSIVVIVAVGCAAFGPALIDKNRARKARKQSAKTGQKYTGHHYKNFALAMLMILPTIILTSACGEAAAKRTAQSMVVAAVSLDEGIIIKRELRANGELSKEAETTITHTMLDADHGLLQITDTAECFERYTADVRTTLINASGDVINSLDNLNRDGILHIKSAEGQRRFRNWLLGARLTVTGIRAALEAMPAQVPSAEGQPTPQLTRQQQAAIEAIRELCRRASLRLHENETKLLDDLTVLEQQ
jgi:hypothetical protein